MKRLMVFSLVTLMILSSYQCNNKVASGDGGGVLKGKLVIKEICAHYVIQVTSGKLDTSIVANGWKDDKRNQAYDNVFTIANRCGFTDTQLNEGDEFEFRIDKNPAPEDCLVCMAFYPTPGKRHAVRIVKK